jgi:pantothenate kinase type III
LHEKTGQLPKVDLAKATGVKSLWGHTTDEAMLCGAIEPTVSLIEKVAREHNAVIYITGGASALLEPRLSPKIKVVRDDALVLKGLLSMVSGGLILG